MKPIFISFLLIIFSFSVNAQKETGLTWYTDMTLATEAAVVAEKPLLLFFTGSDWCGWCHRLQREVFNTTQFNSWASTDVILVELDFPRNKVLPQNIMEQNQLLQQQFAVQGYPTVWFVNVTREDNKYNMVPLNQTGYLAGGPDVWINNAKSIINTKK
jgi:protein disulfide-isomerase